MDNIFYWVVDWMRQNGLLELAGFCAVLSLLFKLFHKIVGDD